MRSHTGIEDGNSPMAKPSLRFALSSSISALAWTSARFALSVCNYVVVVKDLLPRSPLYLDNIIEIRPGERFLALCACHPRLSAPGIPTLKPMLSL